MSSSRSVFTLAFASILAVSQAVAAQDTAATWPGLRGPSHDGAVREASLVDGEGLELGVRWQRELGSGYSLVAAGEGRVVAAFQSGGEDVMAAFDPESGEELWRYPIAEGYAGHTGSHDGPIASPALAGDRVYGLGPRGQLFALDAENGKELWKRDLAADFAAEAPFYGFGASPVVADGVLVVQIGAKEGKSVGGFDVDSGELLWSVGDDTVEYNTPVVVTLGGRSQVVAAGTKVLRGLDPKSGELLWSHEHGGDERAMGGATTVPIPAGENRLLLLNKQPESTMLEITSDDGWQVREVWTSGAIKATYVQPVYHDGHLYGMNSKIFTCVDAETGETVWRSREPGDGFPTLVGDKLVIMTKPGVLRVAEASPEGYRELASVELFDEVSWSAPAYSAGAIYLRSMDSLARVDPVVAAGIEVGLAATASAASGFAGFVTGLSEGSEDAPRRIDDFLASYEAAGGTFPIIEPDGTVHFVYRGDAEDVGIVGDHVGFRREDPMVRVAGTDLFVYSDRLEHDAAITYGFLVDYAEATPDPRNPNSAEGLFGEVSLLEMPGRDSPGAPGEAPEERRGRLADLSWESEVMEGKSRRARVYLPAGFAADGEARYPTLYVQDGDNALDKGALKDVLDHAIGESVAPLIVVFIALDEESGRRELQSPKYAEMVVQELVPLVDSTYPTIDDRLARAAAGAAGAGDATFKLAFAAPETFGRLGTLWATLFAFSAEPPSAGEHPLVVYQRWGSYHLRSPHENFDSADFNRELRRRLRDRGHRPAGGEVSEGFGWAIWQGYAEEMLRVLFPLPRAAG